MRPFWQASGGALLFPQFMSPLLGQRNSGSAGGAPPFRSPVCFALQPLHRQVYPSFPPRFPPPPRVDEKFTLACPTDQRPSFARYWFPLVSCEGKFASGFTSLLSRQTTDTLRPRHLLETLLSYMSNSPCPLFFMVSFLGILRVPHPDSPRFLAAASPPTRRRWRNNYIFP